MGQTSSANSFSHGDLSLIVGLPRSAFPLDVEYLLLGHFDPPSAPGHPSVGLHGSLGCPLGWHHLQNAFRLASQQSAPFWYKGASYICPIVGGAAAHSQCSFSPIFACQSQQALQFLYLPASIWHQSLLP